jgi:hypothetical protein
LSDCIVTNSLSAHFYYKSLNINSYISGDSRPKIKYYNSEKKLYDVSFIGSIIKGRRPKFINAIEKTNLRYLFIDTSNDKNRITENKYNKIIRQSYINLNFTSVAWPKYDFFSIFDPFINNSYGFKGRVIEAGMNKGFVLSEYDSDTKYFWRNNEVSFFYNKNDMLKKINYYLKNKNTRNLIANNIYKKCIKNHITINCYNSLLKKILKSFDKKIKHEVNQSINDVHFKKLEATFLLLYVFIVSTAFLFCKQELHIVLTSIYLVRLNGIEKKHVHMVQMIVCIHRDTQSKECESKDSFLNKLSQPNSAILCEGETEN